ncbi:MAG: CDP-glucose 4,6-dehydratase [Acetobacteraceae bacterium]|nr:CDP-glucose 4,6-dehydratase [Acetobacteraceae bacterium]
MIAGQGAAPAASFWSGRRVFLTGHTGFKGAWLAAWLRSLGASVHGYALPPEPGPSLFRDLFPQPDAVGRFGDIRDAAATRAAMEAARPEIVLHLAAQALVRRSYADPLETFATNVMGTAHVLEAARAVASVRAVVVVSSDKCYENREWVWPYREDEALGGHDPYSASKACTEIAAAAWRRSFGAEGKLIASARAGNVIGGGDWAADRLLPDCARAFAAGQPVRLRNPHATRPWQHVLEPLSGYLRLAEVLLGPEGARFAAAWNFGPVPEDAEPVGLVARLAAEAWGPEAVVEIAPDGGPHEAGFLSVDASRARALLGWRPRWRLAQAVARTLRFYRAQHEGARPAALVAADIAAYATPS